MPSKADNDKILKYVKKFCIKAVVLILQTRTGVSISTECFPNRTGKDWFNLNLVNASDFEADARTLLSKKTLPSLDECFFVDLSHFYKLEDLETDRSIESWFFTLSPNPKSSFSIDHKLDDTNSNVHQKAYHGLSLMIRSIITICHNLPAYQYLKKVQTNQSLVYRIGSTTPTAINLSKDEIKSNVCISSLGYVALPFGLLNVHVKYRLRLTFMENVNFISTPLSSSIEGVIKCETASNSVPFQCKNNQLNSTNLTYDDRHESIELSQSQPINTVSPINPLAHNSSKLGHSNFEGVFPSKTLSSNDTIDLNFPRQNSNDMLNMIFNFDETFEIKTHVDNDYICVEKKQQSIHNESSLIATVSSLSDQQLKPIKFPNVKEKVSSYNNMVDNHLLSIYASINDVKSSYHFDNLCKWPFISTPCKTDSNTSISNVISDAENSSKKFFDLDSINTQIESISNLL